MTNKQALEIVLKFAKFGDEVAQVKGLYGKRMTDKERDESTQAIQTVEAYMDYDENIRED